jgi:uncharacterized protein
MSKFPQSNLPPKSQPWARDIEKAITSNASSARSSALNTNNNLKQINSSINLLQQQQDLLAENQSILSENQSELAAQQAYLNGFTTYSSTSSVINSTSLLNQWVLISTLSLTFTLDRNSSILVEADGESVISAYNQGIRNAGGYSRCDMIINGSTFITENGSEIRNFTSGFAIETRDDFISNNSRVVLLAAGTYTITAQWYGYLIGVNASASVRLKNLTATVVK